MDKILPTVTAATTPHASSRNRRKRLFTALLIVLCVPIFFYNLAPRFSNTINTLAPHLLTSTSKGSFCTKEIGGAQCCALYLAAAPCLDECRNQHVDRISLRLTMEYEVCEGQCLSEYGEVCGRGEDGMPL